MPLSAGPTDCVRQVAHIVFTDGALSSRRPFCSRHRDGFREGGWRRKAPPTGPSDLSGLCQGLEHLAELRTLYLHQNCARARTRGSCRCAAEGGGELFSTVHSSVNGGGEDPWLTPPFLPALVRLSPPPVVRVGGCHRFEVVTWRPLLLPPWKVLRFSGRPPFPVTSSPGGWPHLQRRPGRISTVEPLAPLRHLTVLNLSHNWLTSLEACPVRLCQRPRCHAPLQSFQLAGKDDPVKTGAHRFSQFGISKQRIGNDCIFLHDLATNYARATHALPKSLQASQLACELSRQPGHKRWSNMIPSGKQGHPDFCILAFLNEWSETSAPFIVLPYFHFYLSQ